MTTRNLNNINGGQNKMTMFNEADKCDFNLWQQAKTLYYLNVALVCRLQMENKGRQSCQ
jgi:hypothetical protein